MTTPFRPPQTRSPSRTLLVVMILVGLFSVCSVGALVLRRFSPHPGRPEAVANLKYAFTAERAYFQEKDEYRADFGEVGFVSRAGEAVSVSGTCPADCLVTIVAVGNLDADPDFDIRSISTQNRTIGGVVVPPGQFFHDVDDLK